MKELIQGIELKKLMHCTIEEPRRVCPAECEILQPPSLTHKKRCRFHYRNVNEFISFFSRKHPPTSERTPPSLTPPSLTPQIGRNACYSSVARRIMDRGMQIRSNLLESLGARRFEVMLVTPVLPAESWIGGCRFEVTYLSHLGRADSK